MSFVFHKIDHEDLASESLILHEAFPDIYRMGCRNSIVSHVMLDLQRRAVDGGSCYWRLHYLLSILGLGRSDLWICPQVILLLLFVVRYFHNGALIKLAGILIFYKTA